MRTHEWDAIVVGAGIIGCAVARQLSRRGMRTIVLETRTVGAGATQASAGVLAPYIEAPGEGALQALAVRSLAMYDGFIDAVSRETGAAVEYRRCGTLEVAADAESAARLIALGEWTRSVGVDARWIEPADVAALEPAVGPTQGGLLVPAHGYVRASQLTAALMESARLAGASFVPGRRVDAIEYEQDGATVKTGSNSYSARNLVIAAGSWSGTLANETAVKPVRGQLLQLHCEAPRISRVLWSDSCYIVPWTDGTLLVGATVEDVGFDERVTVGGVHGLLAAARALLPLTSDATFVAARAGLRPGTSSGLPVIERSAQHPAVITATGHYRNGILLAPLTARLVSDLIE